MLKYVIKFYLFAILIGLSARLIKPNLLYYSIFSVDEANKINKNNSINTNSCKYQATA